MKNYACLTSVVALMLSCVAARAQAQPREWVDGATGHRVIRLSEDEGGQSLYFHQNAFTATGDKMVMVSTQGISTVNLKTREIELVVPGVGRTTNISHGIIVGVNMMCAFGVPGNITHGVPPRCGCADRPVDSDVEYGM